MPGTHSLRSGWLFERRRGPGDLRFICFSFFQPSLEISRPQPFALDILPQNVDLGVAKNETGHRDQRNQTERERQREQEPGSGCDNGDDRTGDRRFGGGLRWC